MLQTLRTIASRVLIFIPGAVMAYVASFTLFPYFDQRVPFLLALLITYCLVAYIGIPTLVRIFRLVHQPKHIPLYCVTPDGLPCDPINLAIVGTEAEVKHALYRAGWFEADPRTVKTLFKFALSMVFKRPYEHAPFSSLFLFGRKQDFGFQIPVGNSPRHRHHVRFWRINTEPDEGHEAHWRFWQNIGGMNSPKARPALWVGAATLDTGLGIVLHSGQLSHRISGDTNAERDFVVETIQTTGLVRSTKNLRAGQPYTLTNRVLGTTMVADGEIVLVNLRKQHPLLQKLAGQSVAE